MVCFFILWQRNYDLRSQTYGRRSLPSPQVEPADYAYRACGILPCEEIQGSPFARAERFLQSTPRAANSVCFYLTFYVSGLDAPEGESNLRLDDIQRQAVGDIQFLRNWWYTRLWRDGDAGFESLLQNAKNIFFVAHIQKIQLLRVGFFHLCHTNGIIAVCLDCWLIVDF